MEKPQLPKDQPLTVEEYRRMEKAKRDARTDGFLALLGGFILGGFAALILTGHPGWVLLGTASVTIAYIARTINSEDSMPVPLKAAAWIGAIITFAGYLFHASWMPLTAAILIGLAGVILAGWGVWKIVVAND